MAEIEDVHLRASRYGGQPSQDVQVTRPANRSRERRERSAKVGGEAGIRTLGRVLKPYNGLANRRLQPLGHLTVLNLLAILAIRRRLIGLCSSLCSSSPDLRSYTHVGGSFPHHRFVNDSIALVLTDGLAVVGADS